MELPLIIKRFLAVGLQVPPYQLPAILLMYEKYKLPDEVLNRMDETKLNMYKRGLYLSGQEYAREWSRGHELLAKVGFIKKVRKEGHRSFISMVYQPPVEE